MRSRRHGLNPAAVGLSTGRRRRTQGLRREEVAERAGISCEWYVKLEQGRDVSPSAPTVEALGRALQLNEVDLAHLRSMVAAEERQPFRREDIPDVLRRLVASLPEPAYVTGRRFDVLCHNEAAAALFGNFGQLCTADRNILHWMLADPSARQVFGQSWADEARRIVSLFRASHDLWQGDPAFAGLVDRLRKQFSDFPAWWSEHEVAAPLSGTKRLHHPVLGEVGYEYASFQSNDDPAIKLSLYTRC